MTGYSVLSTAISGLTAAQRGMDVTGQNIVNSNTPGYSRQLVKLDSVAPSLVASVYTGGNNNTVGGVALDSVVRVRDSFIEATRVTAGAAKSALDAQSAALQGVETLVNEPSDSSLQATMDEFFASWGKLATLTGASATAAGAVVIEDGNSVAAQLNFVAAGISQQWNTSLADLNSTVTELNDTAAQLANLNGQIVESSAGSGQPVNELLDKRDTLLRKLGELAGGQAAIQPNGTATVVIGGTTVVYGKQTVKFEVQGGISLSGAAADPPKVVASGDPVEVRSGKAAGLLAALGTDLPEVAASLDATALALRDSVNAVHSTGFTPSGVKGTDFFTATSALDIKVAVTQPSELATSSSPGVLDGANARLVADLSEDANARATLGDAGASERWRALASGLGSKIQGLTSATAVQNTIVAAADSAVESNAGVNLDEEMTNLLMFQRAYQAAAKVISAVDEMMDTLINRLGI